MNIKTLLILTITLTFILINLGGYVHNTGSSLACPDWPLCHGQVMPNMVGGVLIEHTHRLLASLVGFLTLIIAIMARKNPRIARLAYAAVAMVIAQGILGGLTVIYKLPTLVSTAHLGLSMIFLCTLVYLHHSLIKYEIQISNERTRKYLMAGLILIYTQVILGALLRHLGLGPACGIGYENSLLCFDHFIPDTGLEMIHMLHRYLAFIAGAFILMLNIKIIKTPYRILKIYSAASFIIIPIQILLGIMTVGSGIDPIITTVHLMGATLLLITIWKIYLLYGTTQIYP